MSSKQTALVTGATGLLGREVHKEFGIKGWKSVGTGFSRADKPGMIKCDVTDESSLKKVIDQVQPQVIVHCAANRFPDSVAENPDAARALNVTATGTLARLAQTANAALIYISTDYVFPGRPGEAPYKTTDKTEPGNLYGVTKLEGEEAVLKEMDKGRVTALRVPVLYGSANKNADSAVNVLVDKVNEAQEKEVKMDDWSIRYPTCTEDVGRVAVQIAQKLASGTADVPPVLQFSSEDAVTKYGMCERFAEILGVSLEKMVAEKEGPPPDAPVQRPYDTHLSTDELKKIGVDVQCLDFTAWWRRELGAFRH